MAFKEKQKRQIFTKLVNIQNNISSLKLNIDENNIEYDINNLDFEIEKLQKDDKELRIKLVNRDEEIKNINNSIQGNIKEISILKKKIINEKSIYDNTLFKEFEIYKKETQRIKNKKEEFINNKQQILDEQENSYLKIFTQIENIKREIICLNKYLDEYVQNKIDVRETYLELLMKHNSEKKQLKNKMKEYNDSLEVINMDLNHNYNLVNNYDSFKYKINNDYYQWKEDVKNTKNQIITIFNDLGINIQKYLDNNDDSIFDIDIETEIEKINNPLYLSLDSTDKYTVYEIELYKRIKILKTHLKDILKDDFRQNTLDRYTKLDNDKDKWVIKIQELNTENKRIKSLKNELQNKMKGTKYIMEACSYLNVNKKDYIQKKSRKLELQSKIIPLSEESIQLQVIISELKKYIKNNDYPKDIIDSEKRCNDRKNIMSKRLIKKYEDNKQLFQEKIDSKIKENSELFITINNYKELDKLDNNDIDNDKVIKEEINNIQYKIGLFNKLKTYLKQEESIQKMYDSLL